MIHLEYIDVTNETSLAMLNGFLNSGYTVVAQVKGFRDWPCLILHKPDTPPASEPVTDIEYNIGGHFYSAAVLEKFIIERGQREIDFASLQADMRRMADENQRLRAFVRQLDDISIATIPHASLISIVYRWQREARALLEAEVAPEAGGDNL